MYRDDRGQLDDVVSAALEHDLPIMEFHSMMPGDRDAVLDSLQRRGGIVAAIRCLDEGVDLPPVTGPYWRVSTVEREYIQRRGRALRMAGGQDQRNDSRSRTR